MVGPERTNAVAHRFEKYGGKLSIRLDIARNYSKVLELASPLGVPLESFDSYYAHRQIGNIRRILAASTISLRAVALPLMDSYSDINFSNLTSLRIYYNGLYTGLARLVDAIQHFPQLTRFGIRSIGPACPLNYLEEILHLHLPPSLRWFSIENDIGFQDASELAAALPHDTCLAELNFPRGYWGRDEEYKAKLEDICRSRGVKLSVSKHWELWKDFCTSHTLICLAHC